jgi:hypothetical protein
MFKDELTLKVDRERDIREPVKSEATKETGEKTGEVIGNRKQIFINLYRHIPVVHYR